MTAPRPQPLPRADFRIFVPVETRWHDNDIFGHVNNVVYYAYFDTAVNRLLVERGLLQPATSPVVGLVVETACTYFESLAFPDRVEIGVAVTRIGGSSVTYRLGAFKEGEVRTAALCRFTHVHVNRQDQRPVPIPTAMRAHYEALAVD